VVVVEEQRVLVGVDLVAVRVVIAQTIPPLVPFLFPNNQVVVRRLNRLLVPYRVRLTQSQSVLVVLAHKLVQATTDQELMVRVLFFLPSLQLAAVVVAVTQTALQAVLVEAGRHLLLLRVTQVAPGQRGRVMLVAMDSVAHLTSLAVAEVGRVRLA
jgi:hypothetical protein